MSPAHDSGQGSAESTATEGQLNTRIATVGPDLGDKAAPIDHVSEPDDIPSLDEFERFFSDGRVDRNGYPNRMRRAMHYARSTCIAAKRGDMVIAALWMDAFHRACQPIPRVQGATPWRG